MTQGKKRKHRPHPVPAPAADSPSGEPAEPALPDPTAAFDALYDRHAATLTRQAYLLTGRPRRAQQAVERAFQLAWRQWPEVARAPDPAAWVRAATYEEALSPWHRLRPWERDSPRPTPTAPAPAPTAPADRALLDTLLGLPAPYRRTLLLHDGLGLGLGETAAELEASTPAAGRRLAHARETVALRLPELGLDAQPPARKGEILHDGLARLAAAHPVAPPPPRSVRTASERGTRWTTRAALGLTGLVVAATAVALLTAPESRTPPPGKHGATASPGARAELGGAAAPDDGTGPTNGHPGTDASPPAPTPQLTQPPEARLTPDFP
ncbi:hypothetical protein FCH28_17750 [Streptomyces piniterrae]|uniref:RNA polymerase sigma factor 70 region 4 type 2 domain-containing protein n=1 Tax=Streptomyces piniterrae TaxID=2571125 RepID=A0A4U0NS28_9ACTN|nr:sigma factor-like helix-turn-helix DNA-binding protein [Streptomyces piniterrae]TJZ53004.1 hypothetical protein FCH28_17750 [Streptomyces piniterrae]